MSEDTQSRIPKHQLSQPKRHSPSDRIKTKSGYTPTNCGEPKDVISNISTRMAYRGATTHIDEDPYNNCCTIEADSELKLYLWKATELPVKLTKADSSITFLYAKELKPST